MLSALVMDLAMTCVRCSRFLTMSSFFFLSEGSLARLYSSLLPAHSWQLRACIAPTAWIKNKSVLSMINQSEISFVNNQPIKSWCSQ